MVDYYTKSVLTLIAAALIWIAAKDILPMTKAHAQTGWNQPNQIHVVVDEVSSTAFLYPVPVKIQNY